MMLRRLRSVIPHDWREIMIFFGVVVSFASAVWLYGCAVFGACVW